MIFQNKFEADAFIGENGITQFKEEGDKKTPKGLYGLGVAFGTHKRNELHLDKSIKYIQINENLYWVDDINSKYYNQMIDISKTNKDWNSAEHLIDYKLQYEYAIEIKVNPNNTPKMGSAIFLHCTTNKPTAGCIAINKNKMTQILELINVDTKIYIKNNK